jgi:hypothetical protein
VDTLGELRLAVGDLVVYASHGVARVAIRQQETVVLEFAEGGLSVTLPLLAEEIGASRGVDPSAADAWIGDQLAWNGDREPLRETRGSATSVAPLIETTRRPSGNRARRRRH